MTGKFTPLTKILIVMILLAGVFGLIKFLGKTGMLNSIAPQGKYSSKADKVNGVTPIRIGVVTWGGYVGGQYFNGGFKASTNSRYYKEYGILVEFVLIDDYNTSREAWKANNIDLLWTTADSYCTETPNFENLDPKIVFQADWSRGGDAIVVREGINKVSDLRNKKVAVAFGTPSHTFLLWLLNASGMTHTDIDIIEVQSAIDSAAMFKSGKVDAAVVWSPDDSDCIKTVPGSKVLKNTKEASKIIADVFYAKSSFIDSHKEELGYLLEGWFKGTAEINSSEAKKREAAKILSDGLNQPEDFCLLAINNTRLANYGDNINFFNLKGTYVGVTGEKLYSTMSDLFTQVGLIRKNVPAWRTVIDTSVLRNIDMTSVDGQEPEGETRFTAVSEETGKKISSYATKKVIITFASGSSELDPNAKYIIRQEFIPIAQAFAKSRVRVEGNTDSDGNLDYNIQLSKLRAQAVINYLVSAFGFDKNRFVAIGNGPNKPIANNNTVEGKSQNRRTEFELLNN